MEIVWILSVLIGLTLSEKLDRTYLPPPGSKFSGGSPGAIDVPLEYPKETYSSRMGDNSFGRPEVAIGIDRVGPNISPEKYGDITSTEQSLQGNSFSFPTTSTSFAFSQTTSFLPAASSTIGPDILINSKYPNSISINNHFDHDRPFNGFKILEEAQVLNDDKKISQNQISDNGITSQGANKINDESVHSNNRNIFNIPTIQSQSGDLGIQGITSSPLSDEIDHSLFHNNYDTYYSPSPSEPISLKDGNLMPSTSIPSNNINTKTLSNSPVSITNTPYSYRTLPERKQSQDREAVILNYENTITPDGYAYSFDTSNGIHADEKGTAINGVQAVGSYSYIGDDGQLYNVSYTADENGFRPYGAHLPTAPPIPDAILKVIEQATIDKANGIYHDGSYDDSKYGYRKYNPKHNIMFLNQNKKDKDGINFNTNVYNTHLPYYTRLNENLNKNNDTIREHEQNTLKNNIQSFIKNGLLNESSSEFAPNYKSNFEIIEEEHVKNTVNDDEKNLQNNISNSVPHLEDIGKDKIMSIEVIDELGYHYSKPQNKYPLEAADNVINRFSETPALTTVPAMYKKIVENKPARPFMTPYVSRNDDISGKHDGDDQPLDIPALYHKEDVILNNQKTNLPIIDTKMILGKTNENIHNFSNKFKRPDIYLAEGQGYLYSKNGIPRNDSLVSHITSTETGISDITSSLPTDFPSRFNTMESNEKIPQNPSEHSESSFLQNQNVLLDQENYRGPVTHSNKQNSYGNIHNEDDSGFRYNMANMNEANRDTIEHSTTRTYGEDFSGPKRPQTYDSLTGYHY